MSIETFKGFDPPVENWSKLPHQLIAALPIIQTIGEMKVILYILRHTWGYQEEDTKKKITGDEFMHGRKLKNGSRIDNGTGLSKPTIIKSLKLAEEHGFVETDIDDSDKARVKKFYSLKIQGLRGFTPEGKGLNSNDKEALPRSEKETIERNYKKESAKINFALPPYPHSSLSGEVVFFQESDTLHRAIVTRVMGKTLNLTLTESGLKKKYVRPAGAVFYQNGSEELSPVEVGAAEAEPLSENERAVRDAIIDLMPEPGFIAEEPYKRARRMKEITESARKASAAGMKAEDFEAFGIWYREVSWAGRDSPPPITLETVRKNWESFNTYRGGNNGQVGQRNSTGKSGSGGQAAGITSDQTAAYIEQNRSNLERKLERLTR